MKDCAVWGVRGDAAGRNIALMLGNQDCLDVLLGEFVCFVEVPTSQDLRRVAFLDAVGFCVSSDASLVGNGRFSQFQRFLTAPTASLSRFCRSEEWLDDSGMSSAQRLQCLAEDEANGSRARMLLRIWGAIEGTGTPPRIHSELEALAPSALTAICGSPSTPCNSRDGGDVDLSHLGLDHDTWIAARQKGTRHEKISFIRESVISKKTRWNEDGTDASEHFILMYRELSELTTLHARALRFIGGKAVNALLDELDFAREHGVGVTCMFHPSCQWKKCSVNQTVEGFIKHVIEAHSPEGPLALAFRMDNDALDLHDDPFRRMVPADLLLYQMKQFKKNDKFYFCPVCYELLGGYDNVVEHVAKKHSLASWKEMGLTTSQKPQLMSEESVNRQTGEGTAPMKVTAVSRRRDELRNAHLHLWDALQLAHMYRTHYSSDVDGKQCFAQLHQPANNLHLRLKHLQHPRPTTPPSSDTAQFQCPVCGVEVLCMSNLQAHIEQLHASEYFRGDARHQHVCTVCHRSFGTYRECREHYVMEHFEAEFPSHTVTLRCPMCYKNFASLTNLMNHLKSTEERMMGCPECPAQFDLTADLIDHLRCQHKNDEYDINNIRLMGYVKPIHGDKTFYKYDPHGVLPQAVDECGLVDPAPPTATRSDNDISIQLLVQIRDGRGTPFQVPLVKEKVTLLRDDHEAKSEFTDDVGFVRFNASKLLGSGSDVHIEVLDVLRIATLSAQPGSSVVKCERQNLSQNEARPWPQRQIDNVMIKATEPRCWIISLISKHMKPPKRKARTPNMRVAIIDTRVQHNHPVLQHWVDRDSHLRQPLELYVTDLIEILKEHTRHTTVCATRETLRMMCNKCKVIALAAVADEETLVIAEEKLVAAIESAHNEISKRGCNGNEWNDDACKAFIADASNNVWEHNNLFVSQMDEMFPGAIRGGPELNAFLNVATDRSQLDSDTAPCRSFEDRLCGVVETSLKKMFGIVKAMRVIDQQANPDDHGTNVAGLILIGASAAQGSLMKGMIPRIKLRPYPSSIAVWEGARLTQRAVTSEKVAKQIRRAADDNCGVINISLSCEELHHDVEQALKYTAEKDCVVVAASGNALKVADNHNISFPASHPKVVAVGATHVKRSMSGAAFDTEICDFTKFRSSDGRPLKLFANGRQTYSTLTGSRCGAMHGTSMASPLIAGAIAAHLRHYRLDDARATAYREHLLLPHRPANAEHQNVPPCNLRAVGEGYICSPLKDAVDMMTFDGLQ